MLAELLQEWEGLTAGMVWQPHPSNAPQVQAYFSDAFETLYGGAAGGGKSDLLLGLARTMHTRSLLLRRTFPDLERSLISRSLEFYGDPLGYNQSKHVWNVEGRRIEFGHMERIGTAQVPRDEAQYASAPYDLIGFDQLEQFTEYAYTFMFSRVRSARKHHSRILSSANPVGEGVDWIMRRWRAWLIEGDARPGELRYYKRLSDGTETETTADDPDGLSRTFIPAGLKDNPYLGDDYRRNLMSLPEPLRSALLDGNWAAMLTDDAYQVIPREWVRLAMKRWTDKAPMHKDEQGKDVFDDALVVGADVARGGDDKTVFAPRRGSWFDRLHKHPGRTTPDGQAVADLLWILMQAGGTANMDVIGVGASAYDAGKKRMSIRPINFSEASRTSDKSGTLHFANTRAEAYWKFREALDPTNERLIQLPLDDELEADLCAPRWSSQSNGIKIEDKDDIEKRIGRSPDCGDAVVLSWLDRPVQVFI